MKKYLVEYQTDVIFPGAVGTEDCYPEQIEFSRIVEDEEGDGSEAEIAEFIAKELKNNSFVRSTTGFYHRTSKVVSFNFKPIIEKEKPVNVKGEKYK